MNWFYVPLRSVSARIYYLFLKKRDLSRVLFQKLGMGRSAEKEAETYSVQKLSQSIAILLIGGIAVILVSVWGKGQKSILSDNRITRPNYQEEEQQVELIANVNQQKEHLMLTVSQRRYSEDDFVKICQELQENITNQILENNSDAMFVRENLNFSSFSLPEEYPFSIEVRNMSGDFISSDGVLSEQIPESGAEMILLVEISYQDYEFDYEIPVKVVMTNTSEQDRLFGEIVEKMAQSEECSRENSDFDLPLQAGGNEITWEEPFSVKTVAPFLLVIVAAVLNYLLKNTEIKKKISKREDKLKEDYPVLVNKLGVFLGAGVPLKEAMRRMAYDYQKEVHKVTQNEYRPAYEEMVRAVRELESGESEARVYEKFGKRCGGREYVKLGMLLSSHCKKGSSGLIKELRLEGSRAWEEGKANARRKGEEAGTKLLFPMIMVLVVVMAMIMIPAFSTFV